MDNRKRKSRRGLRHDGCPQQGPGPRQTNAQRHQRAGSRRRRGDVVAAHAGHLRGGAPARRRRNGAAGHIALVVGRRRRPVDQLFAAGAGHPANPFAGRRLAAAGLEFRILRRLPDGGSRQSATVHRKHDHGGASVVQGSDLEKPRAHGPAVGDRAGGEFHRHAGRGDFLHLHAGAAGRSAAGNAGTSAATCSASAGGRWSSAAFHRAS